MKNANDGNLDDMSSRLAEGIKSCRAVIDNYRSLLSSDLESPLECRGQSLEDPAGDHGAAPAEG